MKCEIRWVDSTGKPTDDDNEAIGYAYREAYRDTVHHAVIDYEQTRTFPICAEHAQRLNEPGMQHWNFLPFEGGQQ